MVDPGHGVARRLLAAQLTASLMPLNSTMIAVAVPEISTQFHSPRTTVTQALVASYLITAIALQSPGGKLGDRLGQSRAISLGRVAIGAGALLALVAPHLVGLTVARMLMAFGGALAVPATIALMRLELPPERRGRAFGALGATMGVAAAVGPLLGGALIDAFSWPALFLVNVPVLAVAVLVTPKSPVVAVASQPRARFDWVGSGLLTLALALAVVAAQQQRPSPGVLVVALMLLLLFVWWERRANDPVVALGIFWSAPFAAGSLVVALQNLVMYGLLFELPLVLDALFPVSAGGTGLLLSYLTIAMVVASLLAGRLADRWGPRPVAVSGALSCLAGLLVLNHTGLSAPGDVRVPLILLGAGIGLSTPAAQTASLSSVSATQSGMAAGAASTMRYLGAVAGIALLGRVLRLDDTRAAVLTQHRMLLAVFAVMLLASLACAGFLPVEPSRRSAARSRDGVLGDDVLR
ncbi:MAG: MFS transporter [Actinomycetales bacterium]